MVVQEHNQRSCALILPIFNEQACLADTLARIKRIVARIPEYDFEIICVNDGSTDGSAEILDREDRITVLTHDVNRGYGAALHTGLDHCTQQWVFIVDADGSYELEDLEPLLREAERGADMVVGARTGKGISIRPLHRFARWILRKMVRGLTGVMVSDLNSGIRVFRRALYMDFRHLLPMGFSFTTTITVASLYGGYKVRYIPTAYHPRIGKSNIRPLRDFMGFVILIIRLASYFEPLRFFLPLSFFVLVVAIARGVRDFFVTNALGSLTVVMFLMALQIFVMGVIADVVVRRAQASVRKNDE